MTLLAIATALLVLLSLRLYLRNLRLVVRFRSARHRLRSARAQLAAAERFAGAQLVRNVKRRAALVRIAQYCRRLRDDLDVADVVGAELTVGLHEQAARYDAAIEALTARIAELLPRRGPAHKPPQTPGALAPPAGCASLDAFFDEELDTAQADAFRDHLATCERCQRVIDGRMQEQVATNRSRCEDRIAFLDGALSADQAEMFRAHLPDCAACQQSLPGDAALSARLSTLTGES